MPATIRLAPDEAAAWHTWLVLGGRGAGKTRAGAEWVNGMAGGLLGIAERRAMRIALVGETLADVRDVMVHGPSGLVADGALGRAAAVAAVAAPARMAVTAPSPTPSRPRTRIACAGRSSRPPGRTSSASGATRKRPGTCCSSACGSARGRARS